ncbi:MAG: pantoate--beta-alanine ligase [Candidatus Saganbacteria bacterium]|nr:pantoate--beta-alanine ligase [Candidatus Saganbacteria bacterium]
MKTIKRPHEMKRITRSLREKDTKVGFVPTMGALHEGHLQLVRKAKKHSDVVIVSIFVNPTQFGPKEDYKRYPRDLKRDISLLLNEKVDMLFVPDVSDMYPQGHKSSVKVGELGNKLCGKSRPGHFNGVATIVKKFLNIINPHKLFLGAKDFQQQVIIRKMIKDLDLGVDVVTVPTVREKDGLAKSSRNRYLSAKERHSAAALSRSLTLAKSLVKKGQRDPNKIISDMKALILKESCTRIDYISICDPDTLEKQNIVKRPALIALAVFVGKTRLIDNLLIK